MSRKDYRLIAETIRAQVEADGAAKEALRKVADALCCAFYRDNANFKPMVFMNACGF